MKWRKAHKDNALEVYKAIKSGKREFGNRLSFLLPQIQEEREDAGMSKFSLFMRENKTVRENEKYAPTKSLLDGSGKPLAWEFQHISSKENENIRESSTMEVQVKGKPNVFRPKLNSSQYLSRMIVASTVFPDLYDKELQDSYGVMTPEELVFAMVDDPGEYNSLCEWLQKFQGFTRTFEEKVDEAKN